MRNAMQRGLVILVLALMFLPRTALPAEIFDKVEAVGASFLKIQPDPRGEGLGGAYSALTKGASGVYWNPGGLAFASGVEIADQGFVADEIDWPADLRLEFEALALPLGELLGDRRFGTIGVWWSRLETGPMRELTEYDQEGTDYLYAFGEEALGFSYAHRITESLGLGFTYKQIETELGQYPGDGDGFDIGGAFHKTLPLREDMEIEIGAATGIRNLGSLKMAIGSSADLPRQGYVGAAPTLRAVPLWDWLVELTLVGELTYDDPLDKWTAMGGVEIVLLDGLAARFGKHNAEASAREDSWGLGIAARYGDIAGLAFDYAKTQMDRLDDVERFMLTLRFLGCTDGLDIRALIQGHQG